jgi:hypothetical protein
MREVKPPLPILHLQAWYLIEHRDKHLPYNLKNVISRPFEAKVKYIVRVIKLKIRDRWDMKRSYKCEMYAKF